MVLISREWLALVAASMVALSSVVAAAPEPHDHNSQHHHRHDRKMRGALDNDAIAPAKDSSSSSSSAKEHGSLKDRLRWGKAAAGMRASHGGHFAPSPPPALADAPLAAASTAADCDKDYHPSVMSLLTSPTAKAGDLIPNQYIVVFKKNVDKHTAAMHLSWLSSLFVPSAFPMSNPLVAQDETAASISAISSFANEFHVIRNWFVEGFKGYAVRLPEVVANSLKKLPEVDFVEQDQVITILGTQKNPPSWGLSRVGTRENGARDYVYPDSAGAGVDAYIVDTGTYIDHPDFEGRASIGASFSTDKNDKDGNGHGTHVSGTVGGSTYGVAKKVRIVAVKVLNSQGSGSNSDVISGIEWVATEAPKRSKKAVANMSLGGGASAALDAALRSAISNGIAFAVAAGNSAGDACKLSPARVAEALTVAASDKNDKLASFSEKGKCVDLIAPGVDITSTWNNGQTNTISGTSMASPHGCGVLALALGESNYTTVKDHKSYVVNIGTRGLIANVPSNTPNILLHADVTVEPQDPLPEPPSEPEDPEEPGDGVCPFPRCLFDPSCTSCCFEGVDC